MKKITLKNAALLSLLCVSVAISACKRSEPESIPAPAQEAPANAANPGTTQAPVLAEPAPPLLQDEQPALNNMGESVPTPTIGIASAEATNRSQQLPVLRAVRSGRHPGYDRLVFEFDTAGLPAWRIEYVDRPVRDCGSGEPIPVAGDGWLQVRFTGARAHTEQGESTSGPRRRALPLKVAREMVRTCDFEGEVTWVIGVASPNPYTPRTLSDPARLVIDIVH